MSLRMEIHYCDKCGKAFSWNPDVGHMFCPYCGGKGTMPRKPEVIDEMLNELFGKSREKR